MNPPLALFWHRRDLRFTDNTGLHLALGSGLPVLPVFIFDQNILEKLPAHDARVQFIHQELARLQAEAARHSSTVVVVYGRPEEVWPRLLAAYDVKAVFTNRDYEPYARTRDQAVAALLAQRGIPFTAAKDHVLLDAEDRVRTGQGRVYTVFTPYSRAWRARLTPADVTERPSEALLGRLAPHPPAPLPTLAEMGFQERACSYPGREVAAALLKDYAAQRNYPAVAGTSRLGLHLRFGTVSVRALARQAQGLSDTFLNELIWRDFYAQILDAFPQVVAQSFKPDYDRIAWRDVPEELARWQTGTTGYPLVDAGMRELNATGYMHNRVRMVTASFLTKHLLMHWRLGEAYFAEKLLDYDLASNNGGWQWAAGSGTDAAPYFRVFNPSEQARKFDPQAAYIRRWVPEYGHPSYPKPVVEHVMARQRCLHAYSQALKA